MNPTSIEQLMHDVLDGVADAEARARLDAQLAADPALRAKFEALEHLFETLERVPMHEAPEDLHAGLMRRIVAEADRPRAPGWMTAFADAFRARPVPAFAMSVVTIAALALVLWTGVNQRAPLLPDATLPVTGTMAPLEPARGGTLESGDARVTVRLSRTGQTLTVEIQGAAPSGATLEIATSADGVQPPAFEGDGITAAGVEAGRVRVHLDGPVGARMRFTSWPDGAGDLEVALITATRTTTRLFNAGPGGTGP